MPAAKPTTREFGFLAIILAAGDSSRFGRPKALLPFQQSTFLEKIISDYQKLKAQAIRLVLGRHADQIQPRLSDSWGLQVLINSAPERGPMSSLRLAVQHLPEDCQGFFVHPVDHPAVQLQTLVALLQVWSVEPRKVVKPRFAGRGGHPLLFGRNWQELILQLPAELTMRDLLRQRPSEVVPWEVADSGVVRNVNSLADYHELWLSSQDLT